MLFMTKEPARLAPASVLSDLAIPAASARDPKALPILKIERGDLRDLFRRARDGAAIRGIDAEKLN